MPHPVYTHHLECAARPLVVVHGGTSSPRVLDDGCHIAARAGAQLHREHDALAMAVHTVVALEDDGRFNAGSGAVTAIDGSTIEMDAAVMDSRDRLGAVAAIRDVRNPVLVAREVADSPHWLLVGEGAQRFARAVGLRNPHEVSPRRPRREAVAEDIDLVRLERMWNFPAPFATARSRLTGGDTVGAVARDAKGGFAAAASTGGLSHKLLGRVGDTPAVGCGFYAGARGAFAITGIGERIVRAQLAFRLHQWLEQDVALVEAMQRGLALFDASIAVGMIGIDAHGGAVCANRDMAFAIHEA
ncbi:MAG TPA: isoaspartyl peptidase/L-asparaginase [Casimicrobiaceae bacterium]|nr:isoaspartyl peptidase/L-asparaginase [Casimicrobiaceae bacterium]